MNKDVCIFCEKVIDEEDKGAFTYKYYHICGKCGDELKEILIAE